MLTHLKLAPQDGAIAATWQIGSAQGNAILVRWRATGSTAEWTSVPCVRIEATATAYTITGLVNGKSYDVRICQAQIYSAAQASATPAVPSASEVLIGISDGLGWGAGPSAAALKAAHVTYVRANYEQSTEHPDVLLANGLTPGCATVGNTPDGTVLSGVDTASWLTAALAQADDAVARCGSGLPLEVGNEMYLKGGHADPIRYAQMFDALAKARPTYTLLFSCTGDYQLASGSWSQIAGGRGWLGDALAAVPALKTEVGGFVNHPYGKMKPTPENQGNYGGPGALVAQHDQAARLGFAHADKWWLTEYGSTYPKAADGDLQEIDCQVAYDYFIGLGYVRGIFWFQFRDYTGMNPPATGAYNADFTPRPVVAVLQKYALANGQ